jgi:hypothetical protein
MYYNPKVPLQLHLHLSKITESPVVPSYLVTLASSSLNVFFSIMLGNPVLCICEPQLPDWCDWVCNRFKPDPRFEGVKNFIRSGAFGDYDYSELLGSLEGNTGFGKGDYFLVGHDFPSYIECQDKVDKAYRDQEVRSLNPKHSVFSTVINTTALGNNIGVIDWSERSLDRETEISVRTRIFDYFDSWKYTLLSTSISMYILAP